jgi:hypothetical protein
MHFLLILLLVGPLPEAPKKCINACRDGPNGVTICWYWEKPRCAKREVECVDSNHLDCVNNEVRLGDWYPVQTEVTFHSGTAFYN